MESKAPSFMTILEVILKVILALALIGFVVAIALLITDQFLFSLT